MFQGNYPQMCKFWVRFGNNSIRSPFVMAIALVFVIALTAAVIALPVRAGDVRPEMPVAQNHLASSPAQCDFDDPYEPNNEPGQAGPLPFGSSPTRLNFHTEGDEDWFLFSAFSDATYTITTSNLSLGADTVLYLFQAPQFDENIAIAWNDDFDGTLASQIVWTAPKSGLYFFKVRDFNWRGDCRAYDLSIEENSFQYWPFFEQHPTLTPTSTPTFTPMPTPSITLTPADTPAPTPTDTPSPTITPTPLPVPVPSLVLGTGLAFPNDVAVNPQTHRIYVTSRDANQVVAIDAANNQIVASISVCQKPYGIDVNSQTNKIYVTCFMDDAVDVIDGNTNTVTKTISVGPQPTYVGVNESTNRVYIVTHGNGSLVEIDGGSNTFSRGVKTDRGAFGLAVNESLNRVYVTNRDLQNVSTVDTNTMMKIDSQTVRPDTNKPVPFGIVFNPSNDRLYVTYEKQGRLIKVAVYQASVGGLARIDTLTVPNGGDDAPGALGVNPTTNHIFIPNPASNLVTVIDSVNNSILYNIPLGSEPFGVDVDPVTNKAYVATKNSHQLWMIPD